MAVGGDNCDKCPEALTKNVMEKHRTAFVKGAQEI